MILLCIIVRTCPTPNGLDFNVGSDVNYHYLILKIEKLGILVMLFVFDLRGGRK